MAVVGGITDSLLLTPFLDQNPWIAALNNAPLPLCLTYCPLHLTHLHGYDVSLRLFRDSWYLPGILGNSWYPYYLTSHCLHRTSFIMRLLFKRHIICPVEKFCIVWYYIFTYYIWASVEMGIIHSQNGWYFLEALIVLQVSHLLKYQEAELWRLSAVLYILYRAPWKRMKKTWRIIWAHELVAF